MPKQTRERREYMYGYNRLPHVRERQRLHDQTPKRKEQQRWAKIKRIFGLTRLEWESIFNAQNQSCAICGTKTPGIQQGWQTDHVPDTTIVRGILCRYCNIGLGVFRDSPELLDKAKQYLLHAGEKNV